MATRKETTPLLGHTKTFQNDLYNKRATSIEKTNPEEYGNGKKIWWLPFLLLCVFTTSSGMITNSMVAELPVFTQVFPEKDMTPMYGSLLELIGIVGPAIYILISKVLKDKLQTWIVVVMILVMTICLSLELIFLWDWTEMIFGARHSMPLMSMLIMGIVDASSAVVYPHYMTLYKTQYVSSLYIGSGISSFSIGFLGLVQGVGSIECVNQEQDNITNGSDHQLVPVISTPTFPLSVYFVVILVIVLLSTGSFLLLHFHKAFTMAKYTAPPETPESSGPLSGLSGNQVKNSHLDKYKIQGRPMSKQAQLALLFFLFWSHLLLKSVHFTLNIYSCQSYGMNAYSISNRVSFMTRPLAVSLVLLVRVRCVRVMTSLVTVYTLMEGYLIYAALMNPDPPLREHLIGEILIVAVSILAVAVSKYADVCVVWELRERCRPSIMIWVGVVSVLGAVTGALICMLIIMSGVIQKMDPCDTV